MGDPACQSDKRSGPAQKVLPRGRPHITPPFSLVMFGSCCLFDLFCCCFFFFFFFFLFFFLFFFFFFFFFLFFIFIFMFGLRMCADQGLVPCLIAVHSEPSWILLSAT